MALPPPDPAATALVTGGPFHESPLEDELQQVRLVCEAPTDLMRRYLPSMIERVPRFAWLDPEDVARAGLEGLRANERVVVRGTLARVASTITRFAPQAVQLRLAERAFRP